MTSTRDLAVAYVLQLRHQASTIDLANNGGRRSAQVLVEFFHELMTIAEPDLFVEAGAFDAAASRRTVRSLPQTRVVAFEANPDNYRIWTSQVGFSDEGIDYRHAALAAEAGPVTFYLRSRGCGVEDFEDNSILPRTDTDADLEFDTVDVLGTTLDIEFDSEERPAIWIDVEGANREVITGGSGFFDRCGLAIIEVEDDPLWEGQWLTTDVVEAMLLHGLVPLARDVQSPGQHNIVFVSRTLAEDPRVVAAHTSLLSRQRRRELPGALGRVRRDERMRRVARRVRDSVRPTERSPR